MAAATPPPCIHSYHRYSLSSSATPTTTTTSTFSPLKLYVSKPHNYSNSNPNRKHSRRYALSTPTSPSPTSPSTNSTPVLPSAPPNSTGASDSELRVVLEIATNSELFEIEKILFGPSYLSPLLKSVSSGVKVDRYMIEDDFEEREHFIDILESRFLYLAADARSMLRRFGALNLAWIIIGAFMRKTLGCFQFASKTP